jgi:hypothetical protein
LIPAMGKSKAKEGVESNGVVTLVSGRAVK